MAEAMSRIQMKLTMAATGVAAVALAARTALHDYHLHNDIYLAIVVLKLLLLAVATVYLILKMPSEGEKSGEARLLCMTAVLMSCVSILSDTAV